MDKSCLSPSFPQEMCPIPFIQKVPMGRFYNQQVFLWEPIQWHGPIACVQIGYQRTSWRGHLIIPLNSLE
jgi:hypothetical protein